ncbi:MAG TPA: hypothetical protein PKA27_13505 [Fimbriimonadaceae bacterium]|nr:hypothetical protein [Fimbriimonadaceae bacterium]
MRHHPEVEVVGTSDAAEIEWHQGTWHRKVRFGDIATEIKGLIELMDNNPLVCTDEASVPDAASTLALIAVGPIIRAGILFETPSLLYSFDVEGNGVDSFLATEGWSDGATVGHAPQDFGGVLALTAVCAIETPPSLDDIDLIYDEAYGRSFFVRRDEESEWHASLVLGRPHAAYRLRISPDEPHSLLTVQVMADSQGKCGAAQLVHMMNVMCGFEESVGIA